MAKHKAKGAGSVMAHAVKGEIEDDDPETKLFRALNFFPTPPWASRAGAELVLSLDPGAASVLEPCAGMGHMAEPLKEYFREVHASDIHAYGANYPIADFTDPEAEFEPVDWVVCNPPFKHAASFARMGLRRARRGVALLCRLSFIESVGRYPLMKSLSVFSPFAERVPMVLGRWDPEIGTATAHAWFVWMADDPRNQGAVSIIPPGTKQRLWKPHDVRDFAKLTPTPLFDLGSDGGQPGDTAQGLLIGAER